jgi:hypothetical protein
VTRPLPLAERFWPKVKTLGPLDCWEWQAAKTDKGYGVIASDIDDRKRRGLPVMMKAHRASWELARGPLPSGPLCVLHRCDNPPCVNPTHLFLGTNADNIRDMHAKGRDNNGPRRHGSANHLTKLTPAQALEMRELYQWGASPKALATRFGVNVSHVRYVGIGRLWKVIA